MKPIRCINCHRRRQCILVEASVPCHDDPADESLWDPAARLPICRGCLRDDFGTLAHFLLESL